MKKEKKTSIPFHIASSTFPTVRKFEKIIDPIINTEKKEQKMGPREPQLPEHMVEISSISNPFTIIRSQKIKKLKELENQRKEYDLKKLKESSVYDYLDREKRIKYNSHYNVRKLKYDIDMQEIYHDIAHPRKPFKQKIDFPETHFISNPQFLLNKRRECLLDLAINMKEEQFTKLENVVKDEEEFRKIENKRLDIERDAYDEYLKGICQKTADVIKIADEVTTKKTEVIEQLKRAQYNMAHLNSDTVKMEEEYLRLKTYKEFLKKCHSKRLKQQILERTSLLEELKIDSILNDTSIIRTFSSRDSRDSANHPMYGRSKRRQYRVDSNTQNSAGLEVTDLGEGSTERTFNKQHLGQLKSIILAGFTNASNEEMEEVAEVLGLIDGSNMHNSESIDTMEKGLDDADLFEEDTYFNSPQDLVNVLSDLEANNLSLIENLQEQEEMCDQMKDKIQKIKNDMTYQITKIDKHIARERLRIDDIESSIDFIKENKQFLNTFNSLDRYKKIFSLGKLDLHSPDQMMDYLHQKISDIYHTVFERVDTTKSNTIEMLKRLETLIDSLHLQLQEYERTSVLKSKKAVDEKKREIARLRQKEATKLAEQMKIHKAMEKAKMPPRYVTGRKIVYRSDPPKQIVEEVEVDLDELLIEEENKFFFT